MMEIKLKDRNNSYSISNFIFIFAISIVLLVGALIFYQFNKLLKANDWVSHTYQVILAANKSIYYFNYLESQQRGYLLLNDNEFLPNFDLNLENVSTSLKTLLDITKDNPGQQNRIKKYMKLMDERMVILRKMVDLKKNNQFFTKETNALFIRGKTLSDEINNVAQEIVDSEMSLLEERSAIVLKDAHIVNLIFLLGEALSIIFLIGAFVLSLKESHKRAETEKNNKIITSQLKSLIGGARDMIAAINTNYQYIIFNQAYQKEFKILFGKNIALGDNVQTLLKEMPETSEKLMSVWEESLSGKNQTRALEFSKEGAPNTYEITPSLIKNEDNETLGAVHIIRNITERIKEKNEIKSSYEQLNKMMNELEEKNEKITLLLEMSDIMLASSSVEELSSIIAIYCSKILNFASGAFYMMHPSKDMLELSGKWGSPSPMADVFLEDQCWSLRLGHIHYSTLSENSLICDHAHINRDQSRSYLCVPLRAQNDIFGILYVEYEPTVDQAELTKNDKLITSAFAEVTALALANVRLRENLRYQSIRDPLTSLYNRRYLEEFLSKQVHQSERTGMPITVLLMDLDHFKRVNDIYGHDTGDYVLKEFTQLLTKETRPGDIAARYGGEEFIVILYNTDKEAGRERAESIRSACSRLHLKYGAEDIGELTVSIGVTFFPYDTNDSQKLIDCADKALYTAKKLGRNQVVLFEEMVSVS